MGTEHLNELRKLGFKNIHLQAWLAEQPELQPVRISSVDRGLCTALIIDSGTVTDDQSEGSLAPLRVLPHDEEKVAVGDWVLVDPAHEHPRVLHILPRASLLARGAVGARGDDQPVAANVDIVFTVAAAGPTKKLMRRGLNLRRIERYVIATRQAGALPVVVVNKCDLTTDSEIDDALGARLNDIDVIRTSALVEDPFVEIRRRLDPEMTAVLVGPSGVGKSTITNSLLGNSALATKSVRSADSKGRHTTTRRSLHVLDTGALLIDTPGMREFGMASAEGILELSAECRFSDCTHGNEPGCAVQEAVASGELSAEWVQDQLTLKDEALRHEARRDAYSRHLVHKKEKRQAGVIREALARKRKREG